MVRRILHLFKAPTTASLTQLLLVFVTEVAYYKVRSDFHLLRQPRGQWLASKVWNKINFEDDYWISAATVICLVCYYLGTIFHLNKKYPRASNDYKMGRQTKSMQISATEIVSVSSVSLICPTNSILLIHSPV